MMGIKMKPNIPVHYQKGEHSMWNIVSQCCIYIMQMKITIEDIAEAVKCWSKCIMFYQPTCEEICFALKEVDKTAIDISFGPHKRIWLSLEDRLLQAKEIYLIPWMILESEIFFIVKSTPTTTISMDHRSFGHHWTARLHLQMKFNVLLVTHLWLYLPVLQTYLLIWPSYRN